MINPGIAESLVSIASDLERIATALEHMDTLMWAVHRAEPDADDDPGELEQQQAGFRPSTCPNCGNENCHELGLAEESTASRYACHFCGHVWKSPAVG